MKKIVNFILVILFLLCIVQPVESITIEDFESASGIWGGWFSGYWCGGLGRLNENNKISGWEGTSGWDGNAQHPNWGFDGMYYNTWYSPFWETTSAHSGTYAGGIGN